MRNVTVEEAARLLGVGQTTIRVWCRSGRLKGAAWRLGSKRLGWQIPEASITALQMAGSRVQEAIQR